MQNGFSAAVCKPDRENHWERKLFYLLTLALMGDPFTFTFTVVWVQNAMPVREKPSNRYDGTPGQSTIRKKLVTAWRPRSRFSEVESGEGPAAVLLRRVKGQAERLSCRRAAAQTTAMPAKANRTIVQDCGHAGRASQGHSTSASPALQRPARVIPSILLVGA